MRIVQLVDFHTQDMGYSDVCLPRALSKLGHEVFVISSTGNVYFNSKHYNDIFKNFHKENIRGTINADGYTLIRLKEYKTPFGLYLIGLYSLLKKIKPDIVQCGELNSLSAFQAALYNFFLSFKLTIECHIHKSVFQINKNHNKYTKFKKNLKNIISYLLLRLISYKIISCYPISKDSYEICENYFLINKKKLQIRSLGTDNTIFKKLNKKPLEIKTSLGFKKEDIVCIYTGRITPDKSPHLLLEAIEILNRNNLNNFKGLFIGDGPQKYLSKFKQNKNAVLLPFMHYKDLNIYYNMSNIGVWPMQESTSQLDALAAGLPIIITNKSGVAERAIESGLLYDHNSSQDMSLQIKKIMDKNNYLKFSKKALTKTNEIYSWDKIARQYEIDYLNFLKIKK